jgi:hypothetical protein
VEALMKNIKISSFIFILISIFLSINVIGYRLLYNNLQSSHEKDTEILFHKIKDQTSDLLVKLMYQYEIEKPTLLGKHKVVQAYLGNHDLNVNLNEIHEKINVGYQDKPYDIYITDKNLTIRNTSYETDLGFSLTFAKEIFEKHKSQNIIGYSFPIREIRNYNFLSYADSYLTKEGDERAAILQVSYTYKNMRKELISIEKLISQNSIMQDMKAYCFRQDDFIYDMMLHDTDFENNIEKMESIREKAQQLSKKLHNNDLMIENFTKNGIHFQRLYMST